MRTIRRKVPSAEEAHRLLDELERSGEDPPTFCRRRGLDGQSLHVGGRTVGEPEIAVGYSEQVDKYGPYAPDELNAWLRPLLRHPRPA